MDKKEFLQGDQFHMNVVEQVTSSDGRIVYLKGLLPHSKLKLPAYYEDTKEGWVLRGNPKYYWPFCLDSFDPMI